MNRNRFVLPLAALLMVPCFIGCSSDDVYQASFNNDQIICTHGEQIVDISLTGKTKNLLHFQDKLDKNAFEMPEDYKSKTIEAVFPYNNGSSAYILFGGNVALPEGEESTAIPITVSKRAFKEKALDSTFTVSLFANQIRYAGYTYSIINEENEFYFDATIETIGADILAPQSSFLEGDSNDYFAIKPSQGTVSAGLIKVYELHDNVYFIRVVASCDEAATKGKFQLTFKSKATTLSGYTCTIEADGLPSKDHFLFEEVN